ncbi:MAG: hypothetical protein GVY22_07050 [Gammaproteobacteria bacterium]|jgi:hypothetical protein|nr:hypothetical protein [Gammaproteobacteria bacterium]
MKELFENLTSILSFGFLGLSFLMLYLGFRGMQTINESSDPNPAQVSLTRFYLIISLVFMIVAGPLQFLLLYAESAFKPAVVLYLGAPSKSWEETFGDIYVQHRNNPGEPIIGKSIERRFQDKDTVIMDVSEIKDFIDSLRDQVQAAALRVDSLRAQLQAVHSTEDEVDGAGRAALGGG